MTSLAGLSLYLDLALAGGDCVDDLKASSG